MKIDPTSNVLVLGSDGFIGKKLVEYIATCGFRVFAASRAGRERFKSLPNVSVLKADLVNSARMHRLLEIADASYIFNMVGLIRSSSYQDSYYANVEVTRILLDCCQKNAASICKIVLVGSAAEYGCPARLPLTEDSEVNPVSTYGLTKSMQTLLGKFYWNTYSLPVITARPFNIYGDSAPESSVVGRWQRMIACADDGTAISLEGLSNLRDYLHVDDVCEMLLRLSLKGEAGQIFNICSGVPIPMREIAIKIIKEAGKQLEVIDLDDRVASPYPQIPVIYGCNLKTLGALGNDEA